MTFCTLGEARTDKVGRETKGDTTSRHGRWWQPRPGWLAPTLAIALSLSACGGGAGDGADGGPERAAVPEVTTASTSDAAPVPATAAARPAVAPAPSGPAPASAPPVSTPDTTDPELTTAVTDPVDTPAPAPSPAEAFEPPVEAAISDVTAPPEADVASAPAAEPSIESAEPAVDAPDDVDAAPMAGEPPESGTAAETAVPDATDSTDVADVAKAADPAAGAVSEEAKAGDPPSGSPENVDTDASPQPSAGGLWTPVGRPWLVALYDVDEAASLVASNGRVSEWRDLSGNARHARQADPSRQPVLSDADERIGGLRSLSAAEDGLHSGFELPTMTYRRVIASAQYKSGTEGTFVGGFHCLLSGDGNAGRWRTCGYLGQPALFDDVLNFDGEPRKNGGSDDAALLPLPLSIVELDHGSTVTQSGALGHLPGGAASWTWPGPYRRFAFTDGSESLTDIERLEGWMAHRDGIASSLPDTHPYRDAAPRVDTTTTRAPPAGYVLHLIGQSNAMGRTPQPSLRENLVGMRLPNGIVVTDGTSPTDAPGHWGVDRVLAEEWTSTREPILLKSGQGGISARYFVDVHLPRHLAAIDSLQAPLGYEHVALWVQGETDAIDGVTTYAADEAEVFDALEAKLPGIRIFSVLLNPAINAKGDQTLAAGIDAVNAAKRANAAEREAVTVIGGYYSLMADNIHYDAAGFAQMAYDFLQQLGED